VVEVGALVATGADSVAIVVVDVAAMGFAVVVGDLRVVAGATVGFTVVDVLFTVVDVLFTVVDVLFTVVDVLFTVVTVGFTVVDVLFTVVDVLFTVVTVFFTVVTVGFTVVDGAKIDFAVVVVDFDNVVDGAKIDFAVVVVDFDNVVDGAKIDFAVVVVDFDNVVDVTLRVVDDDLTVDVEGSPTLVEVPVAGFADVGTLLGEVLDAELAIFATFSARAGASVTCFGGTTSIVLVRVCGSKRTFSVAVGAGATDSSRTVSSPRFRLIETPSSLPGCMDVSRLSP
jgi:hypothetical protein